MLDYLHWEPTYIPTTHAFDISNENFEMLELVYSYRVESHIEKHQRPFKESVDGIGCVGSD